MTDLARDLGNESFKSDLMQTSLFVRPLYYVLCSSELGSGPREVMIQIGKMMTGFDFNAFFYLLD